MNFLNLKTKAFGLDISDFSLKIAKVRKRGRSLNLVSHNQVKIKPGIVRKGEIRKPDQLAEIIKKAIKEVKGEKLGTKNVVVSLPEEKAFLQVIKMPRLSEEDLKSAVIFEAENHIPLSIEEVYLDYQVISSPEPGSRSDHLNVLIVAFPRKIVDSYFACLKKANIKPVVLENESLAISRALIKGNNINQPIFLIDFGSNRSIFIIFAGYSIMFTFSISISSQNFTESISRSMKIDLDKAEKLKIKYGLKGKSSGKGKEVFESIIPVLTDLTEQIKKHLEYYQTHVGGKKVEKILICGAGAKLKGFNSFLSSELKIPVEVGNPWINVKRQELIYQKKQSLNYVTAIGLALRGFNL